MLRLAASRAARRASPAGGGRLDLRLARPPATASMLLYGNDRESGADMNSNKHSVARRQPRRPEWSPPAGSRGIVMPAWLTGWTLKFVVGGAIALSYVAYQQAIRSVWAQRTWISRKLMSPFDAAAHRPLPVDFVRRNASISSALASPTSTSTVATTTGTASLPMRRRWSESLFGRPRRPSIGRLHADLVSLSASRPEVPILRRYFDSVPGGPMVLVGPEGAGRTSMLREVLNGRPAALWIDLKESPAATGDAFVRTLLMEAGYVLPLADSPVGNLMMALGGGGGGRRQTELSAAEVEIGLAAIVDVLEREKARAWDRGVPVFCFDDLHLLGHWGNAEGPSIGAPAKERMTTKVGDAAFSKFLEWLLFLSDAKLAHVLVVTSQDYAHGTLDAHSAWRHRRNLVLVDYLPKHVVRRHLSNAFGVKPGSDGVDDPSGLHTEEAIDMVVRCVGGNLDHLDRILLAALRREPYLEVLRAMVTDAISYTEQQLDSILCRAAAGDAEERREAYERYLRAWDAMSIVRQGPIAHHELVRDVFNEHGYEVDRLVSAKLFTFVNPTQLPHNVAAAEDKGDDGGTADGSPPGEAPSKTVQPAVTDVDALPPVRLLNQSLGLSRRVAAGSPLLRVAFALMLDDETLVARARWVRSQQNLSDLDRRAKKCSEERAEVTRERKELLANLETVAGSREKLSASLGEDEYLTLRASLLRLHASETRRVEALSAERDLLEDQRVSVLRELAVATSVRKTFRHD